MLSVSFWHGRSVLLLGHTGFKGSWMSIFLMHLGARVTGFALAPATNPALFTLAGIGDHIDSVIGDIRDREAVDAVIKQARPEIVLNLAAQPLVRFSYAEPVETFETNVMGSVNLLNALRSSSNLQAIVNVTSDKCYEITSKEGGYDENDPLGGYDPYSSSKAAAELVTLSYRRSFFEAKGVGVATARAGNVIGGGDWSPDRLITDVVTAFESKRKVYLRYPSSTRPWQHVLDPLYGYLLLAENLVAQPDAFSGPWNFGPNLEDTRQVKDVVERFAINFGVEQSWQAASGEHPHEAALLSVNTTKALSKLGWKPTWNFEQAIEETTNWYLQYSSRGASDLCNSQLKKFLSSI